LIDIDALSDENLLVQPNIANPYMLLLDVSFQSLDQTSFCHAILGSFLLTKNLPVPDETNIDRLDFSGSERKYYMLGKISLLGQTGVENQSSYERNISN
jgi:hypothetical protein